MPATIQIRVGTAEDQKPEVAPLTVKLNARKTMDGSVLISDHSEIYIMIMPAQKKVLTFAKNDFGDHVYDAQNRLFKALTAKGVILPETIHAGNIYSSMEASYSDSSKGYDPNKMVLFMVAKWIEEEKPYLAWEESLKDAQEDQLLNPDAENSTELGEVPQKERKGSINAYTSMGRYMYGI